VALLPNRCRLVLVVSPGGEVPATLAALAAALSGGDIASVILARFDATEDAFRDFVTEAVPLIQGAGAAAVVAGDTQAAGRAKADGVHIAGRREALGDAVRKYQPKWIVGAEVRSSRHDALELGEERPDYLFVGRLDGDTHPDPDPKALELAEWWAQMVEIPCIAMAGYTAESIAAAAATGADFVAVSAAVFGQGRDPKAATESLNAILDQTAPELAGFGDADD
jgi:thiamine-phosphate pyrophosphorylase